MLIALIDYTKRAVSTSMTELPTPLILHCDDIRTQTQFPQERQEQDRRAWRGAFGSRLAGVGAKRHMPGRTCSRTIWRHIYYSWGATAASVWMHLIFPVLWSKDWGPPQHLLLKLLYFANA